jgi:hypothetical protein
MPEKGSWKDFIVRSHAGFVPDEVNSEDVAAVALRLFQAAVIQKNLSREQALALCSDGAFVNEVKKGANEIVRRCAKSTVDWDIINNVALQMESLQKESEVIKCQTNPDEANKAGFRINIQAGAIWFVAGLVASPLCGIIFKQPLAAFDKWVNSKDYTRPPIERSLKPEERIYDYPYHKGNDLQCRHPLRCSKDNAHKISLQPAIRAA